MSSRTEGLSRRSPESFSSRSTERASPARSEDGADHTEESVRAVFSSHHREGRWDAADEILVRALFGEVKLDFTQAELPPSGVVELDVDAIFGEVEITVPDSAEVELLGTPVFGSIEQRRRNKGVGERFRASVAGESDRPDEPLLFCITGRAVFGAIKVIAS